MIVRTVLLLTLGITTGLAGQTSSDQTSNGPNLRDQSSDPLSGAVSTFVSSLPTHPGVDSEIARFDDGRLTPEYRQAFADFARTRVTDVVVARLEEMLRDGCSADVSVDFPGERFTGRPDPSNTEKDFEDSIVLTRSSACYSTDIVPEELLRIYSSREVRMAAQSRMEDVYQEDGLTCYAVGGVPLLVGATRSCNDVTGTATERLAVDHSQTVWSEDDDHQPVFFKESVKVAIRLDDGRIGLVHVTLTRSTGLGGLEKRLGRGKIEDSLRQQTEVLAERLSAPASPGHP